MIQMRCQICGNDKFIEKEDLISKSVPIQTKTYVCSKCGNEIHLNEYNQEMVD